jgi:hypothetical protein
MRHHQPGRSLRRQHLLSARALAFSEANIGAGAAPIWAATHNPFAAHNSVVVMAFRVGHLHMARPSPTGDAAAAATAPFCSRSSSPTPPTSSC